MDTRFNKGYSLIEIAVVLVIISLLLGAVPAAFSAWKSRAEDLSDKPMAAEEFNKLVYELKAGKPCPKKGLMKGNGKKVGLLKFCPDTAE